MKSKTLIYSLVVVILVSNCFVGTQRDACRYELKRNGQTVCEAEYFSGFMVPPYDGNYQRATENATAYLIYCLQYYEKLKDCDKDNNRFKPGFYGINWFYFKKSKSFNKIYSMNYEFTIKEKYPPLTASSEVTALITVLADLMWPVTVRKVGTEPTLGKKKIGRVG